MDEQLLDSTDNGATCYGISILFAENETASEAVENETTFENDLCMKTGFLIKEFGDKGEYIKGIWRSNRLITLHSFEFHESISNKIIYGRRQNSSYLLTLDDEEFIARVKIENFEQLNATKSLKVLKQEILNRLKIYKAIDDPLLARRNEAYLNFKNLLVEISRVTADKLENAEDIFQISLKCNKWVGMSTVTLLKDIINNELFSSELRKVTNELLYAELELTARKTIFPKSPDNFASNLLEYLKNICKIGIEHHKYSLHQKYKLMTLKAPSSFSDNLSKLNVNSIFCISYTDMTLFLDLIEIANDPTFLEFLGYLWDDLFKSLNALQKYSSKNKILVKDMVPLTQSLWYYLCISFQEIVEEICQQEDILFSNLVKRSYHGFGGWAIVKKIEWSSETLINQSLERQFRLIFELIKQFKPGFSKNKTNLQYKIKCLECVLSEINDFLNIPQERLVWIYILDNAIADILPNKQMKFFKPSLKHFVNFIKDSEFNNFESFRVVTHNTIRFIVQTTPYLVNNVSETDKTILRLQMESIKNLSINNNLSEFRDLIEVYRDYWIIKESIIDKIPQKFPYGNFKNQMKEIHQLLLNIVNNVLDKNSDTQELIKFFRSFIESIQDFNALEFTWFVKMNKNITTDEVYLINKEKNSYKVISPELFLQKHKDIPRHYLIEIIKLLLDCVINLFNTKSWSVNDQLNAASKLLSAIRKSFLYLKEQPDYLSFDTFKLESTIPFLSALRNSNTHKDFNKRIDIIGESFWYLRKQDEINIKKALELYKEIKDNPATNIEILEHAYDKYLQKFDTYIKQTIDKNYDAKIKFIVEDVKKNSKTIIFYEWDKEFKRIAIPDLLAGLAAVWSIQKSKDMEITGKILKPHCIQILSIFKLLSVDKNYNGVDKQFSQVLTGQGKSLVLGLLCAILAVTGHEIQTVCYSNYLASRDQQDFEDFFDYFNVEKVITYGTFENMANKILHNDKNTSLRDLVRNVILDHSVGYETTTKPPSQNPDEIFNTILLIDEVDVFFSRNFYGSYYRACTVMRLSALAKIQEQIWQYVTKKYKKKAILKEIENLIENEKDKTDFKTIMEFLQKPGTYYLLKEVNGDVVKTKYTNNSFYEEHLNEMIDDAIDVASDDYPDYSAFKISPDGFILGKKSSGIFSRNCFYSYQNIFNYFRLKKENYDHKNYENYGYFLIDSGMVSYAKLPEEFPLILGVTGTLTTLYDYEKKAIRDHYRVRNNSIMPSFFGHTKLKFDSESNFIIKNSKEDWLETIINHSELHVREGRSVIVFFENEVLLDEQLKTEFISKFNRLHILTQNTDEKIRNKYIEEAGIIKTVTIATRQMGRGVDFKSSIAVEKIGGTHVIQTFFSLDIKEETQIKGRTARKDNNGSYELILCRQHLINSGFITNETNSNYQTLNKVRDKKVQEYGEDLKIDLEMNNTNHEITMAYFKNLFEGRYN